MLHLRHCISPLSHVFPTPPQSAHTARIQHSSSSHSHLSPLYHPSAVNTPTSPSAFSFIHPFDSAPGSSASASYLHIGTPPVSAELARSQVVQSWAGQHARKSSRGDEFRYGSSLSIWPCVRYSPLVTCITQQTLHASETHRAVLTIIHLALATRSTRTRWRYIMESGRSGAGVTDMGKG
jgi:hypothetical protein